MYFLSSEGKDFQVSSFMKIPPLVHVRFGPFDHVLAFQSPCGRQCFDISGQPDCRDICCWQVLNLWGGLWGSWLTLQMNSGWKKTPLDEKVKWTVCSKSNVFSITPYTFLIDFEISFFYSRAFHQIHLWIALSLWWTFGWVWLYSSNWRSF